MTCRAEEEGRGVDGLQATPAERAAGVAADSKLPGRGAAGLISGGAPVLGGASRPAGSGSHSGAGPAAEGAHHPTHMALSHGAAAGPAGGSKLLRQWDGDGDEHRGIRSILRSLARAARLKPAGARKDDGGGGAAASSAAAPAEGSAAKQSSAREALLHGDVRIDCGSSGGGGGGGGVPELHVAGEAASRGRGQVSTAALPLGLAGVFWWAVGRFGAGRADGGSGRGGAAEAPSGPPKAA